MDLWTFGDSYGEFFGYGLNHNSVSYHEIISNHVKLEIKNSAKSGSSQDYTHYMLQTNYNKIDTDDIVIVCYTDKNRMWLLNDKPEIGGINSYFNYFSKDRKQIKFYEKIFVECKIEKIAYTNTLMFLHFVNTVFENHKYKPIFLKCFEDSIDFSIPLDKFKNIHFANGHLCSISKNEYKTKQPLYDNRFNHLSRCNHDILASKIINYLENNISIDLESNFVSNFL